MKLTGYTYSCNSLTDFEYDAKYNPRKQKSCISADTFLKIREITSSELIFWRVFIIWNHCVSSIGTLRQPLSGSSA
jgi:hypothetical protein